MHANAGATRATPARPRAVIASPCLWLFVTAALIRLMYVAIVRPPFDSLYWMLAGSLLENGSLSVDGKIVTDFEPLYPLFLAAARLLSGSHPLAVQWLQAVVAAVGAIYLYWLAEALTGRRQIAAIAAALYALDPLLIRQAAAPADPALATTLLVAFAYVFVIAVTPRAMLLAGSVLALVMLTRTMTLPLGVLAAGLLVYRRRYQAALALSVSAFVLLLPFCVRNQALTGSWWPTRSGLNLYIGNSPYTAALLPDYDLDLLEDHAAALIAGDLSRFPVDSPEYNRAADSLLAKLALAYMREDPARTLGQKLWNVVYFFSPRLVPYYVASPETGLRLDGSGGVVVDNPQPRPAVEHIAYSAFFLPILVASALGVYVRRRDLGRDALLWCVVANFVAVHTWYFPATRYRAPMEFVVLLYAATAADRGWRRVSKPITPTSD